LRYWVPRSVVATVYMAELRKIFYGASRRISVNLRGSQTEWPLVHISSLYKFVADGLRNKLYINDKGSKYVGNKTIGHQKKGIKNTRHEQAEPTRVGVRDISIKTY